MPYFVPACEIHLLRSAKLFGGPFNFNESDGKITKPQLSRLLAELLEENDTLTVAVSSLKSREGIKELLIECLDILRFNETFITDQLSP